MHGSLFSCHAAGLFETIPGLMLQPSLFTLTFEHMDETSRNKQLLSLVITWGTTLKMTIGVVPVCCKGMAALLREGGVKAILCGTFLGIPSVVFPVGAWAAMIVGMMRVYHAYTCDDHLWNLFSGCVVF